jgi:hypothetical protein
MFICALRNIKAGLKIINTRTSSRFTWIAFLALALATHAQADGVSWNPDSKLISLDLPEQVFTTDGATLAAELDGYDVSAFGRLNGQTLEIHLETPLLPGEHVVRALLFPPDGESELLLDVVLEVPAADIAKLSLNTLLETNYRASESSDGNFQGIARQVNSGSLAFAAEKLSGNKRISGNLQTVYNPSQLAGAAGNSWLLPTYSFSAGYQGETANTTISAGNVAVSREDLLFSAWKRRGAIIETKTTSGRLHLQAFSVSSAPRNEFDGDYLVPGNPQDRSSGISATLASADDQIRISASLLDGKTSLNGAGFNQFNDAVIYGGKSWNIALDSIWLNESLWLYLEKAVSDFDSDGFGLGRPADHDDAVQAMMQLSSQGDLGTGPFDFWMAYLQYQEVGRDFYSLGNLSLPGNLTVHSGYFKGGLTSVLMELEIVREQSNPDNDPALPTQTLQRAGSTVSWSPTLVDPDNRLWRRLGTPSLRGWLYRTDNTQADSDALVAGFDLDNRSDESGFALEFAKQRLSWAVQYELFDYKDNSAAVYDGAYLIYLPPSDSRNRQASIKANWAPGERLTLNVMLQRNNLEESDFGNEYRSTNLAIGGTFILVPEKLTLALNLNRWQDRNRFSNPQYAAENLQSRIANLQLNWIVRQKTAQSPGVNMFLKGNYGRTQDPAFLLDDKTWSIYLGAAIRWAGRNQ